VTLSLALSIVALGGVAMVACGGERRGFGPKDREAVVAVLETQQAAWNRGDLDGFMAGYERGDDLVFTSGGHVRRGWDETIAKYRAKYGSAPETMGKLAFEILGVQPVGADGAVVLGRWTLTDTPNAGGGIFSVVLERRADGWKVIHDHTSSDPPP
jgi:ketosteroid isomerase-like protein